MPVFPEHLHVAGEDDALHVVEHRMQARHAAEVGISVLIACAVLLMVGIAVLMAL
jgi:hypothetical protein